MDRAKELYQACADYIDNTEEMIYISDCCLKAAHAGELRTRILYKYMKDWSSLSEKVLARLRILGYEVEEQDEGVVVDWSRSTQKRNRDGERH